MGDTTSPLPLSEPSPHASMSDLQPSQPLERLPEDFSSLFGVVEGCSNPNEGQLEPPSSTSSSSSPSSPSTNTLLPSFTPFIESVSSDAVALLRRAEVELQIAQERRREREAQLRIEELQSQREIREREFNLPYSHQHASYPRGQPQHYYPSYSSSADPREATYSPGGGRGREASSSSPSVYDWAPPPPPHLPSFEGYPNYTESRMEPGEAGSDPYSSYRNPRVHPDSSFPQPNNLPPYHPPSASHQPTPHPYNSSQTSLEHFGPTEVYNQLGNLLDQPFTAHSAAGFRRPSSPRSSRPSLVSHQSFTYSAPQQRERGSSSDSSASAQPPQHQSYHSFPPPTMNHVASPDFERDPLPSTSSNPNPFQPRGFANAPNYQARGSISSSSTASNGPTPMQHDGHPTSFASSSTIRPSSSTSGPQSKKKRSLFSNQPIAHCSDCSQPIARLYIRGEKESFEVEWDGWWSCKSCMDKSGKGKKKEEGIARRKRNRETQDIEAPLICDVCMKEKGQGGIVAKDGKTSIDFSVEFVCVGCDSKYQRCTDCGGGGGGRVGIGKWRCKELFVQGRKTCSLAHTRIGAAPLELGVWEIGELDSLGVTEEVVRHCERMWVDRTLARMAVPDVLEVESIDRDGDKIKRSYNDIQATLRRGWPSRDHVMGAKEPSELNTSRRYLGLTWVKTRSRRGTATENEEEDAKEMGYHEYRESALANIKKVFGDFPQVKPLVIPPGSELVGLWVGDWNMLNGTLLISTSLPFEGSDGDDRSALTVGEIACRIVLEIDEINSQRLSVSSSSSSSLSFNPPLLLPPLEHLWVISDGTSTAIRDRMQDILSRRRQFLPLDEYLERHVNVRPEIFQDFPGPKGGDSWADSGGGGAPAEVLVRWLGPHFDRQRLEELAGSEFGKKLKSKKKK